MTSQSVLFLREALKKYPLWKFDCEVFQLEFSDLYVLVFDLN